MPKNVQTTTQLHSSHTLAKECSKFSKPALQQYMNHELPDVQAGFRKGRGTRDQIANRMEYQTTLPASQNIYMQVKKQQLKWYMEKQIGFKLGKEYVKAVYCHPVYLPSMQSTSCKMPGG